MSRPKVICHMLACVDGRLEVERYSRQIDGSSSQSAVDLYFSVSRDMATDGVLIGRKTLQKSVAPASFTAHGAPATGFETFVSTAASPPWVVVLDPKGTVRHQSGEVAGQPIIAILGESVSQDYLDHLRDQNISYLFAGPDGDDLARALEILGTTFGMSRVLLEGGGITNGRFLVAGLIDELSLMIYPGIDGLAGVPSIFEHQGVAGELPASGQALELASCERLERGIVWLRYLVRRL